MKRFFLTLACGLLLFAACSEDGGQTTETIKPGTLAFEISADASSNMAKKAIYSQEYALHVTNVKVHAFLSDGTNFLYAKTYDITGWRDGMDFMRYDVGETETLPGGTYKFLAVGRNTTDMYTLTALSAGVTNYDDVVASVTANGNEDDIYAGSTQATIDPAHGSRININMKRQVAGIVGYFKNIPLEINGVRVHYLRLNMSDVNQAVNLTTGLGVPTSNTPFNIIEIDLFSTQQPDATNSVYAGNDLTAQSVEKLPNSQLSGSYLIPVTGVTMTLGLYGQNNEELQIWKVSNENSPSFDLKANNFYALGQKMKAGYTDNNTADTSDDDTAIDLLLDQGISVMIIPAWDVIDQLTMEPQ